MPCADQPLHPRLPLQPGARRPQPPVQQQRLSAQRGQHEPHMVERILVRAIWVELPPCHHSVCQPLHRRPANRGPCGGRRRLWRSRQTAAAVLPLLLGGLGGWLLHWPCMHACVDSRWTRCCCGPWMPPAAVTPAAPPSPLPRCCSGIPIVGEPAYFRPNNKADRSHFCGWGLEGHVGGWVGARAGWGPDQHTTLTSVRMCGVGASSSGNRARHVWKVVLSA